MACPKLEDENVFGIPGPVEDFPILKFNGDGDVMADPRNGDWLPTRISKCLFVMGVRGACPRLGHR